MDNSIRPAVRNEWYNAVLSRLDQICIQDYLKYSITFYTFLLYHSMFCTFFSTLMVFVDAASNPCHGFFTLQPFHTHDILSIALSVSGFIGSWSVLSVLNGSKIKSEPIRRSQLIYFPYLVSTITGTFFAFCLFLFIISECHFLNIWLLILDKHTLQNVRYLDQNQTLTCFKKMELVQLGVLSFSLIVAGGVSIIRFLCHESLWHAPTEKVPRQENNRTPQEFSQHNGYHPPDNISAGNQFIDNNIFPLHLPNRRPSDDEDGIVSGSVHSALIPDVITHLEEENNRVQQSFQSVDETSEAALADSQSDEKGRNEPSTDIDASSASRPPHLADIATGHPYWIKELERYLAKSNDTNCEIPDPADAIDLPAVSAPSYHCSVETPQQQHSVSISPLGSGPFSRSAFKEKLRKVCEEHISKQMSRGCRLEQRRGAISGPSGGSGFDSLMLESLVDSGKKVESFVKTMELINPLRSKKEQRLKQNHRERSSPEVEKSRGTPSSTPTDGFNQAQSEFGSILGSSPTENHFEMNECQKVQHHNQPFVSIPLGLGHIGGVIRASETGLSSDSDECRYPDECFWFSHFVPVQQQSKTEVLSSDSDESEYHTSEKSTQITLSKGSDSSSLYEARYNSFNGDTGGTTGSIKSSHHFGSTPESATKIWFGGNDENCSQKQTMSKSNTDFAPSAGSVAPPKDCENQNGQQHNTESKSIGTQILQSRKSDFKSNQPSGVLVIEIDSDNDDQNDLEVETIIIGAPIPFADCAARGEHSTPRPREVNVELGYSGLAPIPPVVSADRLNSLLGSSVVIHPGSSSHIVTRDVHVEAAGNQFWPESRSSSEPPFLNSPKLVSHQSESDGQRSGRRDSRTSAMDLDIDESPAEDSDKCEPEESRSRLSSESTDSGLFLDNLFFTGN